jgi:hypothetical protein
MYSIGCIDVRMILPVRELFFTKVLEIPVFRESAMYRTKIFDSQVQICLFLYPASARDFFSLEDDTSILRLENAPFVGFMNALSDTFTNQHFTSVWTKVDVPGFLNEMFEDGSQANILTSFRMRLADNYLPLYSVFAKVVRWIDRSLLPAFPVGDALTTLFEYQEAMPDAIAIMASYAARFGSEGPEHLSKCLQVDDLDRFVTALQECRGFEVAAGIGEFFSVLNPAFADHDCTILVKLLDPLFSDVRPLPRRLTAVVNVIDRLLTCDLLRRDDLTKIYTERFTESLEMVADYSPLLAAMQSFLTRLFGDGQVFEDLVLSIDSRANPRRFLRLIKVALDVSVTDNSIFQILAPSLMRALLNSPLVVDSQGDAFHSLLAMARLVIDVHTRLTESAQRPNEAEPFMQFSSNPGNHFPDSLMRAATSAIWDLLIQTSDSGCPDEQVHTLIGILTRDSPGFTVDSQRQNKVFVRWARSHDRRLMLYALALAPFTRPRSPSDTGQTEVLQGFYELDFPEGPQEMAIALDITGEIFKSRRSKSRQTGTRNSPDHDYPAPERPGYRSPGRPDDSDDTDFIAPALQDVPCFACGGIPYNTQPSPLWQGAQPPDGRWFCPWAVLPVQGPPASNFSGHDGGYRRGDAPGFRPRVPAVPEDECQWEGGGSDQEDRSDEAEDAQADAALEPVQDVDLQMPDELSRLYTWFQKMLDNGMIQEANGDSFIRAACAALGPWSFPLWLRWSSEIHDWGTISAALEHIPRPRTASDYLAFLMKLVAIDDLKEHFMGCHNRAAKLELRQAILGLGRKMGKLFNDDEMEAIHEVVRALAKSGLKRKPPPPYLDDILQFVLEFSPSEACLLQFVRLSMDKLKWLVSQAMMTTASNSLWKPKATHAWAQVFEFHRRCREKLSDTAATAFPDLPDCSVFPASAIEPYQYLMRTYENVITGAMAEKTTREVYEPLQAALWNIHLAFFGLGFDKRLAFVTEMCKFFGIEPFWKLI